MKSGQYQSFHPGGAKKVIGSCRNGKFHGRQTASGERYDKNGISCAHKTLPFGTVLLVTNLDNGKTLQVRVNDRGPFVKGRVIDCSEEAARRPEMLRREREQFESGQRERESAIAVLKEKIRQRQLDIRELETNRRAIKVDLGLSRERFEMSQGLLEKGLTSRMEHLQLTREVEGLRIHYVDEGARDAGAIFLLHGQPSWSYLYRHMIRPWWRRATGWWRRTWSASEGPTSPQIPRRTAMHPTWSG